MIGVLIAVVLWGVSFVATKTLLRELDPVAIVTARFAMGTLLLLVLLARRGTRLMPPRTAWPMLAVMGGIGVFVHHLLQIHGLRLTTAISTGWLIGLIPLWTAILGRLVHGERLRGRQILGLAVGLLGAVVVITRGRFSAATISLPSTRGDLLVLASTITWAIYTVTGRATIRRLGPLKATVWAMALGVAMLTVPFTLSGGWTAFSAVSPGGWGLLLFLGLGCSGLGYYFWYEGMVRLPAARVAAFLYLEPLVTVAAASVWLAEPIVAAVVAGGLLVLAGVALAQWQGSPGPGARGEA